MYGSMVKLFSLPALIFFIGSIERYVGTGDGFVSLPDGTRKECEPSLHITWQAKNNAWHVPEGCFAIDAYPSSPPNPLYESIGKLPRVNDIGTIWHSPIKRAAIVIAVNDKEKSVAIRTDYDLRVRNFRLQADGSFREDNQDSAVLILGIQSTNYVQYKQWYNKKSLIAGPIAGPDVREYLPLDWEKYFQD
jgi:hypothetical protein